MTTLKKIFFVPIVVGAIAIACKKDKNPKVETPALTTTDVTNITPASATSGGTINDNGGSEIIVSGICWSKTNTTPTISDDTAKSNTTSGNFIAQLKNLQGGSTYYVRAWATNSAGTGYGDVKTFNTGNAAPEARNITVKGNKAVDEKLTASYTYFDGENDAESESTFQWYIANDTIGAAITAINGATDSIYTLTDADQSKYIRVGITAKSSAGTTNGTEMFSYWQGAIGAEITTVTFTYNGQEVSYGIIESSVTGRKWLDRNLGAPNTPTAYNDWANYGDLFQWGRAADGHQLINRGATNSETTGVNSTTTTLSSSDNPGHSLFISNISDPFDWRSSKNDNLWQGLAGINNPCPEGWRIPTKDEWLAENAGSAINTIEDAFAHLKITLTGQRRWDNGSIDGVTSYGEYWSSTVVVGGFFPGNAMGAKWYTIDVGGILNEDGRAGGKACRCIKD